jgi:probable HAF family extracellular repeat protein
MGNSADDHLLGLDMRRLFATHKPSPLLQGIWKPRRQTGETVSYHMKRHLRPVIVVVCAFVALATPTTSTGQSFEGLGVLTGHNTSGGFAVNADGSVIVGYSHDDPFGNPEAFRWSGGVMVGIGFVPGATDSTALAVNGAGTVVAGTSANQAFRWTASNGMEGLGHLPGGTVSVASGVNSDGTVVVGYSYSTVAAPTRYEAFRWTATSGMVGLGVFPDGAESVALGTNADGTVIVGYGLDASSYSHAFRWTATTGKVDLGFLPGGNQSTALAVNADGSVIVGYNIDATDGSHQPFRWTASTGLTGLGFLPGYNYCFATSVNASGLVVVGYCGNDAGEVQGFKWTPQTGLVGLGFWQGGDYSLLSGVSADGAVAVGSCRDGAGAFQACRIALSGSTTPTGANVTVAPATTLPNGSPGSVGLTFDQVTSGGSTTVTTSSAGQPPPTGFKLTSPPVYYEISTTATFTGAVRVCLSWAEGQIANENNVNLFHFEGNQWVNITDPASRNTTTNTVCGNTTSLSPFTLFEVKFPFSGFVAPVDSLPTVNSVKAGVAVPVRFSLGGDKSLNIFAVGYPRVQQVQCTTGAQLDVVEETVTAGSSSLTYSAGTGQYTYVWKTDKAWGGSCRELQLRFTDGETYTARFSMAR